MMSDKAAKARKERAEKLERTTSQINRVLLAAIVAGGGISICYPAFALDDVGGGMVKNIGCAAYVLIWACAALIAGAALGFLFGIPRTVAASANDQSPKPMLGVNSNLVRVSDWLTKLILALGLVQLGELRSHISLAGNFVARGISSAHPPTAFAVALLLYFSILGFFAGYLSTRLVLQVTFHLADDLMCLLEESEKVNDDSKNQIFFLYQTDVIRRELTDALASADSGGKTLHDLAAQFQALDSQARHDDENFSLINERTKVAAEMARAARRAGPHIKEFQASHLDDGMLLAIVANELAGRQINLTRLESVAAQAKSTFVQYRFVVGLLDGFQRARLDPAMQTEEHRKAIEKILSIYEGADQSGRGGEKALSRLIESGRCLLNDTDSAMRLVS